MRALFLLFLLSAIGASAQPGQLALGYASAEQDLRLRDEPSSSARHVSSVPQGYPVRLGLCERGWCEVHYVGVRGFVPERHLRPAKPLAVHPVTAQPGPPPETRQASPPVTTRPSTPSVEPASVRAPVRIAGPAVTSASELAAAIAAESVEEPAAEPVTDPTTEATPDVVAEATSGTAAGEASTVPPDVPPALILESTPVAGADSGTDAPPETLIGRAATPPLADLSPAPPTALRPAPGPCPGHVREAQARYRDRAFDEAVTLVSRCLSQGDPSPQEAAPAYRLLSLIYSLEGNEAEAKRSLLRLLALDPAYEPNRPRDPLPYTAFVVDVRRELQLPSSAFQCDWHFAEAQEFYLEGSFERALQVLKVCLDKPDLIEVEAVRAYRMMALAHLRQTDLAAAREAVVTITALMPDYRADPIVDIPSYVALVDLVRTQLGLQGTLQAP
ncbi:MAG: hypothetical protein HKN73_07385 [Gemmatimonadetes bacterium]|nr:hypothetical protein [Gemmatimonadota bacterium]